MADKKQFPSQTADRFIIRLPDGMRDRLAEAAKAANRSMNAEIIVRLEASFAAEDLSSASYDSTMIKIEGVFEAEKRIAAMVQELNARLSQVLANTKEGAVDAETPAARKPRGKAPKKS